jgi:hypothetical protein
MRVRIDVAVSFHVVGAILCPFERDGQWLPFKGYAHFACRGFCERSLQRGPLGVSWSYDCSRILDHAIARNAAGCDIIHVHKLKRLLHIQRSRRKAFLLAKLYFPYQQVSLQLPENELIRIREQFVSRHYQNRKSCSCVMCCNPRHSVFHKGVGGLTFQERKSLLSFQEQMAALAEN